MEMLKLLVCGEINIGRSVSILSLIDPILLLGELDCWHVFMSVAALLHSKRVRFLLQVTFIIAILAVLWVCYSQVTVKTWAEKLERLSSKRIVSAMVIIAILTFLAQGLGLAVWTPANPDGFAPKPGKRVISAWCESDYLRFYTQMDQFVFWSIMFILDWIARAILNGKD